MKSEVNTTPIEYNKPIASADVREFPHVILANDTLPASAKSYSEFNDVKSEKIAKVVSRLISLAAILAIMTALLLPVGNVSAEFVALESTDTAIYYKIAVEGEGDISVVLYNDFTRRELVVFGSEAEGEIDELKPNMSYTIAVKSGKKTLAKQKIRTQKSE